MPGLGGTEEVYAARLLLFQVGRTLLFHGRPADARRVFESFNPDDLAGEYVTPVEYDLGRVTEELGLPEAKRHYQRYLAWWGGADPELDAWRNDARERLARPVAEAAGRGDERSRKR